MIAEPVRSLITQERERLMAYIAREELRAADHRSKLRPLELHIAELRDDLAALDAYDPEPTGHHEENIA